MELRIPIQQNQPLKVKINKFAPSTIFIEHEYDIFLAQILLCIFWSLTEPIVNLKHHDIGTHGHNSNFFLVINNNCG
jgi:hypothetical protein